MRTCSSYRRYILSYLLPAICCVSSTLSVHSVSTPVNPLDIGSVSLCVPVQSDLCSQFIDYLVPEPVANLTDVIEEFIDSRLQSATSGQDEDCEDAVLEALCNEQYPRCNQVERTVNAQVVVNCTERLSACGSSSQFLIDEYCHFQILNASLDQCKTISQQIEESGYVFKQCNGIPSWGEEYVTEWMFSYLMKIDQDIDEFFQDYSLTEQCKSDYIKFRCRSVGRCWDNGNRVELTQNQTDCFAARSTDCFSSSILQRFDPREGVCERWPEGDQLPTIATPITPPTEPDISSSITSTSSLATVQESTTYQSTSTRASTMIMTTTPPENSDILNSAGSLNANYSMTVHIVIIGFTLLVKLLLF